MTAADKRAALASFRSGRGTVAAFDALLTGLGCEGWNVVYSAYHYKMKSPFYAVSIVAKGQRQGAQGYGKTLLDGITDALETLLGEKVGGG